MEFEVQKKEQQMPYIGKKITSEVQEENFDIKEDNEGCQLQKPQMKNNEDKEQIIDLMVNTICIFDFQKKKNCNNAGFGMHKSIDYMLGVLIESTTIFSRSSRVFA